MEPITRLGMPPFRVSSGKDSENVNTAPAQARNGRLDDAQLFPKLAALARESGRPDVAAEFEARAKGSVSPKAAPGPAEPSPAARAAEERGTRLTNEGKLAEGEAALREAVRLCPTFVEAHANLGVALARQGRHAEATAAFRTAVALQPTGLGNYANLGSSLLDRRKPAEAEEVFHQAVHLAPDSSDAHRLLGTALEALRRFEEAEASLRKAIALDAGNAKAHHRLAVVLARQERPEAEASFREAVRLKPDLAEAWSGLGIFLEHQGRYEESEQAAREALRLVPELSDYHNNLGVALAGLDRQEEAEACYREALRLRPDSFLVLNNLGNALRAQDRLTEAEQSLRAATRDHKDYAEAINNLGIVLVQQGKVEEGIACYDDSIRLKPDYAEARMNRSLALMSLGDLERGWPDYEWRWKRRNGPRPPAHAPAWDGSPLDGRTLILHAEQGLGDTLQFVRYAGLVPRGTGGTVVVECQMPLVELAATCPGVDRVVPRGEALPRADVSATLLSLPGLVGTRVDSIPGKTPYLSPDPAAIERWRAELSGLPGLKVGIAWQGSRQHKGDRIRSVKLARFAPLASFPGVQLISMQKGAGSEQLAEAGTSGLGVIDLGSRLSDSFADTAAALRALDLLVCVDTALAHAAGAVGAEVWMMVPFAADWRWLREREDTPWYPTMRLFRQPRPGDWDSVFARVAVELAGRLRDRQRS